MNEIPNLLIGRTDQRLMERYGDNTMKTSTKSDKFIEAAIWIGILNVLFILMELMIDWPIHLKYPLDIIPP